MTDIVSVIAYFTAHYYQHSLFAINHANSGGIYVYGMEIMKHSQCSCIILLLSAFCICQKSLNNDGLKEEGKGEAVPVSQHHTIEAYEGHGGKDPHILNLGT
jgi:hypothetical protein